MVYIDPEKQKEYHRKYEQIPERKNYKKQWRIDNKEKVKISSKKSYLKLKFEILNHYSNYDIKCNCCGERRIEFLSIDHINNDGKEHRKTVPSGLSFWCWLKRNDYPSNFQILCWNCQMSKSRDPEHLCPHQKEQANLILNQS